MWERRLGLLVCLAVASLSALWLLYGVMRSEQLWVSLRYQLAYFGLPAGLLVASLGALFIASPLRLAAGASLIALPAALYCAELALSLTQQTRSELGRDRGAPLAAGGDRRSMLDVVRDLRAAGERAYPLLGPWEFLVRRPGWRSDGPLDVGERRILPFGGVPDARIVYCQEGTDWFTYRSDRHGFNNPDEIWDLPRVQLAAVGNSWILGACLPGAGALPELLRARTASFLNVSAGGTGPLIRLGMIEEYLAPRRPETILWIASGPDFHTGMEMERGVAALDGYLEGRRQDLARWRAPIAQFLADYAERALTTPDRPAPSARPTLAYVDFIRLIKVRQWLALDQCPPRSIDWDGASRILSSARERVSAWGGRLVFVYVPAWTRCDLFDVRRQDDTWLDRGVRDAVARAGIAFIDLRSILRDESDPRRLYYFPGSHFSPEGAAKAAAAILAGIGNSEPGRSRRSSIWRGAIER